MRDIKVLKPNENNRKIRKRVAMEFDQKVRSNHNKQSDHVNIICRASERPMGFSGDRLNSKRLDSKRQSSLSNRQILNGKLMRLSLESGDPMRSS